jgi:hypothetical protein
VEGTNSKRCVILVFGIPFLGLVLCMSLKAEETLSTDGLKAFAMLSLVATGFILISSKTVEETATTLSQERASEDKMVIMPTWIFLPFLLGMTLAVIVQQGSMVYCAALLPWSHLSEIFIWDLCINLAASLCSEQRASRQTMMNAQHALYLGLFIAAGAYQAWPMLQMAAYPLAAHAWATSMVCIGFSRFGAFFPSLAQRTRTVAVVTRLIGAAMLVCCGGVAWSVGTRRLRDGLDALSAWHWLLCLLVHTSLGQTTQKQMLLAGETSGRLPAQLPAGFPAVWCVLVQPFCSTSSSWHWLFVLLPRVFLLSQACTYTNENHAALVQWLKEDASGNTEAGRCVAPKDRLSPEARAYMETAPLWDGLRMWVSSQFYGLGKWAIGWASRSAPSNIYYYLHHRPSVALPNVKAGIAYATFPSKGKEPGPPQVLQCNMGHMSGQDHDWTHTNAATMKMMSNLALRAEGVDGESLGFCGDVVAEFQEEDRVTGLRTGSIRQMNLSAWTSQEASHAWYGENQAHRDIVAKHYAMKESKSGKTPLESFSALLMQAEPSRPLRYHVRCHQCGKTNTKGYPAKATCAQCGGAIGMPLF